MPRTASERELQIGIKQQKPAKKIFGNASLKIKENKDSTLLPPPPSPTYTYSTLSYLTQLLTEIEKKSPPQANTTLLVSHSRINTSAPKTAKPTKVGEGIYQ